MVACLSQSQTHSTNQNQITLVLLLLVFIIALKMNSVFGNSRVLPLVRCEVHEWHARHTLTLVEPMRSKMSAAIESKDSRNGYFLN